jgi:hypothetical protein
LVTTFYPISITPLWQLNFFQSPQGHASKEIWLAPFVETKEFLVVNNVMIKKLSIAFPYSNQNFSVATKKMCHIFWKAFSTMTYDTPSKAFKNV